MLAFRLTETELEFFRAMSFSLSGISEGVSHQHFSCCTVSVAKSMCMYSNILYFIVRRVVFSSSLLIKTCVHNKQKCILSFFQATSRKKPREFQIREQRSFQIHAFAYLKGNQI